MTTIITVTESPSMKGRFTRAVKKDNDETLYSDVVGCDPESAAASAMAAAVRVGSPYVIFGSKKVLDCIPTELRSKS
jgi:hypothetical protein